MFNYEVFVRALLQGPFPNESTWSNLEEFYFNIYKQ
jgi:hypothetical protein